MNFEEALTSGHFSRIARLVSSDTSIFIIITAIILWSVPGSTLLIFIFSFLIIIKYLVFSFSKAENIKPILILLLFYSLWIAISAVLHNMALRSLEPWTYITVSKGLVGWGLEGLKVFTISYFFFPVLLLALIKLFQDKNVSRWQLLIPIIFIPSMMVALYQGLVNIQFLNSHLAARIHRVSGLVTDYNGFGISTFLVFPFCISGIILAEKWWKKACYIVLAVMALWCLFLSGSRTGFLGILIFSLIFPYIWIWASSDREKSRRRFFTVSAVLFVLMISAAVIGGQIIKNGTSSSSVLVKRLADSYYCFREGGMSKLAPSRFEMGLQAVRLTFDSPLAGWGPGGFWRNADNIRYKNGEKYNHLDNANNQYLQMSSELGIFGALTNLILHLIPLWMIFCVRRKITNRKERWTVGICFSIVCIMMMLYLTGPHIILPDVLWILLIYMALLVVCSLKYGYLFKRVNSRILAASLGAITIFFILGTYDNTFGRNGYKNLLQAEWWPLKNQYGYYKYENWQGNKMRWTMEKSGMQLTADSDIFGFTVFAAPHNIGTSGLILNIFINESLLDQIRFTQSGSRYLAYYVSSIKGKEIVIETYVNSTFNPLKMGISADNRDLGVALSRISFRKYLPKGGVGFYNWELCGMEKGDNVPDDIFTRFRWTGMRATMNVRSEFKKGGALSMMCAHPDIDKQPVVVDIMRDGDLIRRETFVDNQWKKVEIGAQEVKGAKALTFRVSRTWNPRLEGVSDDGRDLGVIVMKQKR